MKKLILLISLLLIGCTRTEYINQTIYINNTVEEIVYKNITMPCPEYVCDCSKDRELELIRRIKFLENQQNIMIINETGCVDNDTKANYESKVDMYERNIEEIEEELENCEEELCEYNSSWC